MKTLYLLLATFLVLQATAQTAELRGTVIDEKKAPIIGATLQVFQEGVSKGGVVTDIDGGYLIKPLDSGVYTLIVNYLGYAKCTIDKIAIHPGQNTQNINLQPLTNELKTVEIQWKKPFITHTNNAALSITPREIKSLPTTEITEVISLTPGIYQQSRGKRVNVSGARKPGTLYIIDGVQVQNIGSTGGINMSQGEIENTSEYKRVEENDFRNVRTNPLSTMSVDVDRASYANVRRFINEGQRPPVDAVRIEEMVNYFDYSYPQPMGDDPIAISGELTECPWNDEHLLLRVGIQAVKPPTDNLPAGNFVFLIDVSGSMGSDDKLPLLVEGMKLLTEKMRDIDKVAIVTYAGAAGLVLPSTPGNQKQTIIAALDRLGAGGSTAGGAGIMLAYKTAQEQFIKGGTNRVILATDGDFNVGVSNDNELEALIVKQRETGIFLTCLGFGRDNLKDAKMEMLADKGNGNYHYIDNIKEAQKSLVTEFGSTMFTVAKDVKAQIEFNPENVSGYRLVGYENRVLNEEDFRNDKKDAGDMGSGHVVTIIYELIPTGGKHTKLPKVNRLKYGKTRPTASVLYRNELATIKFRYKKPDGKHSKEIEYTVANDVTEWDKATSNTRFATSVAMFGMLIKGSQFSGDISYDDVLAIADSKDNDNNRQEFVSLVKEMKEIDKKVSAK